MTEFKKLKKPLVIDKNVYTYSSKDENTNKTEFFSEKGKQAIENNRKRKK